MPYISNKDLRNWAQQLESTKGFLDILPTENEAEKNAKKNVHVVLDTTKKGITSNIK